MNPSWTKQQHAEALQATLAGGVPKDAQGNTRAREVFDGIYLTEDMLEDALDGRTVYHSRGLTSAELKFLMTAADRGDRCQSPAGVPGYDRLFVVGDRGVNNAKLTATLEGVRYLWRDGADGRPGFFEMEVEARVFIPAGKKI